MTRRFLADALVLVAAATVAAGCGSEDVRAATGAGQGKAGDSPGGTGGQRGGAVVFLSTTDVAEASTTSLEAGVPITGDLRPLEVVEVRARLEGDLTGVYVREGDRVRNGQLLARFDDAEQEATLRSAQAEQAAARSAVETAHWNAAQARELFRAGAIAEQQSRAAGQEATAADARLAAADAQVRSASLGARDTRVLSPTTGVVERREVEDGERVTRGQPLFTVVRNDVLELSASVPARDANEVRTGQRATFAAAGRRLEGTVSRVSPTIDPATRSITVYVRVPNPGGQLKGNTFATGRVIGRTVDAALVVPSAALRQGQGDSVRTFVYRIVGDRIERAPVEVGVVDDARQLSQILAGLDAGDRVVVGNVGALGSGMQVQIVGESAGSTAARGQQAPR